jgi:hypothetical protein
MNQPGKILVCAPANAKSMITGSTLDHKCQGCGVRVMIAPSGQQFLKSNPDAVVQCLRCIPDHEPEDMCGPVASGEELLRELIQAEPNMFRYRN